MDGLIARTDVPTSLNRVVLGHLPGLPAGMGGSCATEWLSSMGIARRMRSLGRGLDFAPVPEGSSRAAIVAAAPYPLRLEMLVRATDAVATRLADTLGLALAAFVATLVTGPADARAARVEWPPEHWARWASVRRIVVGGGIVSGALGERMVRVARDRLPRLGAGAVTLLLDADPLTLVLRGLAAGLPDGRAALVDAGHTTVKPAVAQVAGGRCIELQLGSPIPTVTVLERRGAALADRLADIAAEAAARDRIRSAGFAVATETDGSGQPLPGQATAYGSLGEVRLVDHLASRLEAATGSPVAVHVANDGPAAAAGVRGRADAAIVLGTAIGAGLNV